MKIEKGDWVRTFNGIAKVTIVTEWSFFVFHPKLGTTSEVKITNILEKIDILDYPEYTL